MREIKFRGWDVGFKEMESWESLLTSDVLPEVLQGVFPNLKLMQYTGLKDRNGVEIYEGDILEMAEQSLLRFEVVYDAGHMAFMRKWIDKRVPATRCKGEMEHLSANTDFLEVIGNGYENPELLKDGI